MGWSGPEAQVQEQARAAEQEQAQGQAQAAGERVGGAELPAGSRPAWVKLSGKVSGWPGESPRASDRGGG